MTLYCCARGGERSVLVWPPGRGAITITEADMDRLRPGEFLNDVIINFYLRWGCSSACIFVEQSAFPALFVGAGMAARARPEYRITRTHTLPAPCRVAYGVLFCICAATQEMDLLGCSPRCAIHTSLPDGFNPTT